MKRLALSLFLLGLIVTAFGSPVMAASPLTVQIDGAAVNTPAGMEVIEGQVMVPLRWAAEKLGADDVQWDSATRTVTIKTKQDFYHMEKRNSYARGLQTDPYEAEREIFPLPAKAQKLQLSCDTADRPWILSLDQLRKSGENDSICIRIVSDDGLYEHSQINNSFINYQGHYYVPMDWMERLFNARVNYDETANVLSIQAPDPDKIKAEIAMVENTIIPSSADEAVKLWSRGEQVRNGGLQYLALSPELRQKADNSGYVRETYWVTGGSSPWVGPVTIQKRDILSDTKIEYTLSFPEMTSDSPYTTAVEKMIVEKLFYNGKEGWFITELLQSSEYGIIDGRYKSCGLYLSKDRISLPLPADWTVVYHNQEMIIKDGQGNSIGSIEEFGGYSLHNHRALLSDKKVSSQLGESHLLVNMYQSPAAAEIQESWQEVQAMIPLKNGHWLSILVKVNPGDDVARLQGILENAIADAAA